MTLAVVRSRDELFLVQSRRRADSELATRSGSLPLASPYDVGSVGLAGGQVPSELKPVAEAWRRLQNAPAHGSDVLADILLVLLSSVPSASVPPLLPLRPQTPPEPPRPTAAHPRAFRGTKYSPPKAGRPAAIDLRPQLCSPAGPAALVTALWPAKTSALRTLRRLGVERAGLDRLAELEQAPSDPYLAFWHDGAPSRPSLPRGFVEHILQSLHGASWSDVRRANALYDRLRLAEDQTLCGLAARLLRTVGPQALAWLEPLATQPKERRATFLILVLETSAAHRHPRALTADILNDLAQAPDEKYSIWLHRVLDGVRLGMNPQYLAAGVRFAREYGVDTSFHRLFDAPDFDQEIADRIESLLPVPWSGDELVGLWETCAAVPGFSSYVRDTDWRRFTSDQRTYLLRFFMDMRWHSERPLDRRRWAAIAACLPALETRLQSVPAEYADQYLGDLGEILSYLERPDEIRERLPLAIDLLVRVNRVPYDPDGNVAHALGNLLKLPGPQRARFLAAPDQSFLVLDKACRRSNAASLITWGLSSLVAHVPSLVVDAFEGAPGPLVRAARHLGVLSWAARAQVLGRCATSPIFDPGLEQRPLSKIVAAIDAAGAPEAAALVPRAVRQHHMGQRTLTSAQIARHTDRLRASLPACRLAVIRAAVDLQLAGAVGARRASRDALAALAVLQAAQENKRSLRRFLSAHLNGDDDYLLRHPETRAWARRHPRIDLALWTRGLDRRVRTPDGREIRIGVEQDPLEVLKMGTYVGSCLGLGGGLTYSAAAALLDVNKQVLYARDDRGSVLARQLLAVSTDDRLVPFAVYPDATPPFLVRAFDRYDSDFASALGIARIAPFDEYDIELVISRTWWDDFPWNPEEAHERASRGSARTTNARRLS